MQADLAHYPPCHDPYAGFVTRRRERGRERCSALARRCAPSRGFAHKRDIAA